MTVDSLIATPEYLEAKKLLGRPPLIFDNPRLMDAEEKRARFEQMWLLYDHYKWPLSKVGRAFGGMVKERVRQIFIENDVTARPMGGTKAFREQRALRQQRKIA